MRLATWNVNSIKVREPRLLEFLARHRPDIVCLQELKVSDDKFPFAAIEAAGYHAAVYGQRTYNGVAILSRAPLSAVRRGFGDGVDDPQARFVAARCGAVEVASVYVPNGQEVGSDAWRYKLAWLGRLRDFLRREAKPGWLVAGDFNVAPNDADVKEPDVWRDSVLCHEEGRAALRGLFADGWVDVLHAQHPAGGVYSWWDYRMLAFQRGNGLRIDLVLAKAEDAVRCQRAWIDRDERRGKQPSDHAPVLVDFG